MHSIVAINAIYAFAVYRTKVDWMVDHIAALQMVRCFNICMLNFSHFCVAQLEAWLLAEIVLPDLDFAITGKCFVVLTARLNKIMFGIPHYFLLLGIFPLQWQPSFSFINVTPIFTQISSSMNFAVLCTVLPSIPCWARPLPNLCYPGQSFKHLSNRV